MGVPAPLFDRLTDDDLEESFEPKIKSYISLQELQESIAEDLSRLLNTRVSDFWRDYDTPYSYGINATCPTSVDNEFEIQELENRIDSVIKNFETRLKNVAAHVISRDNVGNLHLIIDAQMVDHDHLTPLSFPVVIKND